MWVKGANHLQFFLWRRLHLSTLVRNPRHHVLSRETGAFDRAQRLDFLKRAGQLLCLCTRAYDALVQAAEGERKLAETTGKGPSPHRQHSTQFAGMSQAKVPEDHGDEPSMSQNCQTCDI